MKKFLLASIFGVFLFAGTAFILIANEPVRKATETKKPCCEAAAKIGEKPSGCASHATAKGVKAAGEAGAVCCKSGEAKPANATCCKGSAGCSKSETKTTSAAACCGGADAKSGHAGCAGKAKQDTQTSEAATGGCSKAPAGTGTQRAKNN